MVCALSQRWQNKKEGMTCTCFARETRCVVEECSRVEYSCWDGWGCVRHFKTVCDIMMWHKLSWDEKCSDVAWYDVILCNVLRRDKIEWRCLPRDWLVPLRISPRPSLWAWTDSTVQRPSPRLQRSTGCIDNRERREEMWSGVKWSVNIYLRSIHPCNYVRMCVCMCVCMYDVGMHVCIHVCMYG